MSHPGDEQNNNNCSLYKVTERKREVDKDVAKNKTYFERMPCRLPDCVKESSS